MIIVHFCSPIYSEKRATIEIPCNLCHIEQDFHKDCTERAKRYNKLVVCGNCHKFIQLYCFGKDDLFDIIKPE